MLLGIASAASQNELGRRILHLLLGAKHLNGHAPGKSPGACHICCAVPISDLENREEPRRHVSVEVFFDTDYLVEPVIPHLV